MVVAEAMVVSKCVCGSGGGTGGNRTENIQFRQEWSDDRKSQTSGAWAISGTG